MHQHHLLIMREPPQEGLMLRCTLLPPCTLLVTLDAELRYREVQRGHGRLQVADLVPC